MGSIGTPIVNVEVRVVDEAMQDVPSGAVGEIVYRGPTVMQGYWDKPDATDEAFEGGWFHSGDLVRQDQDGFYFVVDRKKDMIISGGEKIYCAEVEAATDAHPDVREVAVIGIPDPKWVEVPMAVIVAADAASPPSEQDIIEWCRGGWRRTRSLPGSWRPTLSHATPGEGAQDRAAYQVRHRLNGTACRFHRSERVVMPAEMSQEIRELRSGHEGAHRR